MERGNILQVSSIIVPTTFLLLPFIIYYLEDGDQNTGFTSRKTKPCKNELQINKNL
jgi:hypothetical protein